MATVNFLSARSQSRSRLGNAINYVSQDTKTMDISGQKLLSGQNCSPSFAEKEFIATRSMHRKNSPVWFYHYTQSFHPEENITGPQAHKVAKEFAEKAWPGSEVLIATHVDAQHIHSHFIVNSVCVESGKMLRQGPDTLKKLRNLSDEICMRRGLSVLKPEHKSSKTIGTKEYRSAAKGQSWKFELINTIDLCMKISISKEDFIRNMEKRGYRVRWETSRKNITYTHPGGMKARDEKLHDDRYLKEVMEHEFSIRRKIIYAGAEKLEQDATGTGSPRSSPAHDTASRNTVQAPGFAETSGAYAGKHCQPKQYSAGLSGEHREQQLLPAYQGADVRTSVPNRRAFDPAEEAGRNGPTGWEEERASLFETEAQTAQTVSAGAGWPNSSHDSYVTGSLAHDILKLGRSLEQSGNPVPLSPAPPRMDKKTWKKLKLKRLSVGHKMDDHEEKERWEQHM